MKWTDAVRLQRRLDRGAARRLGKLAVTKVREALDYQRNANTWAGFAVRHGTAFEDSDRFERMAADRLACADLLTESAYRNARLAAGYALRLL